MKYEQQLFIQIIQISTELSEPPFILTPLFILDVQTDERGHTSIGKNAGRVVSVFLWRLPYKLQTRIDCVIQSKNYKKGQ